MNNAQHRTLLIVLGALTAIGPFSIDMYLPGFASISSELHASMARVGLSLTSYFIGISLGQLIYGPLLDRFGRKRPLFVGLVIYIVSAILCGLSPSIDALIVFRVFLALGACVCLVASRAIVRDLFAPTETAKVYSLLMLIMGVAPIIAPSAGGLIASHLGWRYIFFVLTAIAVLMLWAVVALLPESRKPDNSVSLRIRPILSAYSAVLMDARFLTFTLTGGIAFAGMFAYISAAPFVFMDIFGLNESQFGIVFSLNAIGLIGGSQVNRYLLKKHSSYRISHILSYLLAVLSVTMLTCSWFNWLNAPTMLTFIFLFLFLLGFINPNVTAMALEPFAHNAGSASALLGSLQMIFGALASGLVSTLFDGTTRPMALVMTGCALIGMVLLLIYELTVRRGALVTQYLPNVFATSRFSKRRL